VEELVRNLLEQRNSGDSAKTLQLSDIEVPQSLRLVIGRRLARLSDETQKVLSVAAVIDRSFTFELLRATLQIDADRLVDHLEEAEKSGLISSILQSREMQFQFSHEIVRQAVLGEFSSARRQRIHLRIADAIERIYPDSLEDYANDLAYHLWYAGAAADPGRTIRFLATAANRALQQSAYDAALRYSQNAVELLSKQPDTPERARHELDLQLSLRPCLYDQKEFVIGSQ